MHIGMSKTKAAVLGKMDTGSALVKAIFWLTE